MLPSTTAAEVLTQAVLAPPDAGGPLALEPEPGPGCCPASRGGQRRPIHLQRMEADDLLAAAWPALGRLPGERRPRARSRCPITCWCARRSTTACTRGARRRGSGRPVVEVESGAVEVHTVESSEPSPLAHGILSGRPYTFLDGAPLEERRTRALSLRRGLGRPRRRRAAGAGRRAGPARARRGGRGARAGRARPSASPTSCTTCCCRSSPAARSPEWAAWFESWSPRPARLVVDGLLGGDRAAGRGPAAGATTTRRRPLCVSGHLELAGPVTRRRAHGRGRRCPPGRRWAHRSRRPGRARPWPVSRPRARPSRSPTAAGARVTSWSACTRPAVSRRRRRVEPASIADFVRFLAGWQHVAPGHPARGPGGTAGRGRAAAGDRGPGRRVGGPRAAGPGRPATTPLARRALPVR